MTNFMTKNLFFAEKYSFDLQNIYVKKEPESVDYSNENSFSSSFAKMDQTGIEPVVNIVKFIDFTVISIFHDKFHDKIYLK